MRYYQSRVLANIDKFKIAPSRDKLMRSAIDMYIMWKTVEYFQPKNLLEIGFFAGQTLGILADAAGKDAHLTAVDIDLSRKDVFDSVFPDANVTYINIDSKELALTENYDFVHIDGNHYYEYVLNDVVKCLPHLKETSILCMDDYVFDSVNYVITEQLLGQHGFVPFLMSYQNVFFHHESQSHDHFLDEWIQKDSTKIMGFSNTDYHGYTVLKPNIQQVFYDSPELFIKACEFYNL